MDMTGVRVLGVDNNPTNLFVLREQLNSWGLRNDSSSSAEDALNLLRAAQSVGDPYQIAILDQQMPTMDGEELARTIKADAKLTNTALVPWMTMYPKPIRKADLTEALERPLRNHVKPIEAGRN